MINATDRLNELEGKVASLRNLVKDAYMAGWTDRDENNLVLSAKTDWKYSRAKIALEELCPEDEA
jgi:hypothetical protein